MRLDEQLTAALKRSGVTVAERKRDPHRYSLAHAIQSELDGRQLRIERYKASKPGGFWSEFTRGFAEGLGGGRYEESKHPRQGKGQKGGQFAPKGAGGGDSSPDSSPMSSKAPAGQQGPSQTVTIGGRRYDVQRRGSDWYAKPAGMKKADWSKVGKDTASRIQDEVDRQAFDAKQKEMAIVRRRLDGHKRFILDAIKGGPKNGHAIWKSMGIPKDDFLDAYFALADEGKIRQDQNTGVVSLIPKQTKPRKETKAPAAKVSPITGQPIAASPTPAAAQPQAVVVKPRRTPEEERALAEAKEKTRKELEARIAAGKAEVRKANREENMKRVTSTAEDYGIAPDDLLDAAKFIHSEKDKQHREIEGVKADLRKSTGLTLNDIKAAENSGKDFSTIKTRGGVPFDKVAQVMGHNHPGIFGTDEGEFSAKMWDLLREGVQERPRLYDADILREAAQYVKIHQEREPGDEEGELVPVGGDLEEVPFAKPGSPERYQRYCQYRAKVHRYVAMFVDYYAKQGKGQRSFVWTEEDEQKHPRGKPKNAGQWTEKDNSHGTFRKVASIQEVFKTATNSNRRSAGNSAYCDFRKIDTDEAIRLRNKTGLDLSGYVHSIDESSVRHILRIHGESSERDRSQVPITQKDIEQLAEIVGNPTTTERSHDTPSGLATIVYTKQINGYWIVVEEIRTGKKKLSVKTMYKKLAEDSRVPDGTP